MFVAMPPDVTSWFAGFDISIESDPLVEFAVQELGAVVSLVLDPEDKAPDVTPLPTSFEEWLETPEGQEVQHRIQYNRHSVQLQAVSAYFDTSDDVRQKAFIWLWQEWQKNPGFPNLGKDASSPSHRAAIITLMAVRRSRCMYAKRRYEKRERQSDLEYEGGEQKRSVCPLSSDNIRGTDIDLHDVNVQHKDKRMDVRNAIETVVRRMLKLQIERATTSTGKINKGYAKIPIEHITRTIIEGYMYHYTDRYNQTGSFRKFCEARCVSKNQISKWRPFIFTYLREELSAYAPPAALAH